jgi:hypothetical protein
MTAGLHTAARRWPSCGNAVIHENTRQTMNRAGNVEKKSTSQGGGRPKTPAYFPDENSMRRAAIVV